MSYGERFDEVVTDLIEQEGGFVNHPNDKGGATKYGITIGFYKDYVDSDADIKDIKNLDKEKAKEIYFENFWNPAKYSIKDVNYGDLPEPVGEMVFLYAVNMGWQRANRLLQQAISQIGGDISKDGWLGPKTIEASKKVNKIKLLKWISIKASKYYTEIVLNNSDQKVFLEGWLNRSFTTLLDSLKYIVNRGLEGTLKNL